VLGCRKFNSDRKRRPEASTGPKGSIYGMEKTPRLVRESNGRASCGCIAAFRKLQRICCEQNVRIMCLCTSWFPVFFPRTPREAAISHCSVALSDAHEPLVESALGILWMFCGLRSTQIPTPQALCGNRTSLFLDAAGR